MKSFKNFVKESRKGTYGLDDLNRVDYPSRDDKFSRRNAEKRKKQDAEEQVSEANITSIDKKIDREIDRHKNIQGREPRHNKQKERVRDGIERLRNQRNRLTGNPKSEPVEQTQIPNLSDKGPKATPEKARKQTTGKGKQPKADFPNFEILTPKTANKYLMKPSTQMKDHWVANLDEDELDEILEYLESQEYLYDEELQEVLNVAQRRKRGIVMKRNKAKLRVGRRKAQRRIADKGRLDKRARRQARNTIAKRLTKGKNKSELSPARKAEIERRLSKMSGLVGRIQKRVLPVVRRRDRGM